MAQRPADEIPVDDRRPATRRRASSLVVVTTGPGKGKTTAAIGMVVRTVARGWPVAVIQFLKSGTWNTGEEKLCRQLGVDWWAQGEGFTWLSKDLSVDQAVAAGAWDHAAHVIASGDYRLVVLDEVTYPINWGWIDVDDAVAAIKDRPRDVSVVITGRHAPDAIVEIADTVSEIADVKHALRAGYRAKKGIDY